MIWAGAGTWDFRAEPSQEWAVRLPHGTAAPEEDEEIMKRTLPIGILCAVLALQPFGGLSAAPKAKTVIEDPVGDANGLNDQGTGDGSNGDNVTPADASSVTDLTEITLANDSKNLYVTFLTEAAPPATQGVGYRLRMNPEGTGGSYCLLVEVFYPGAGNALDSAVAQLRDTCTGETTEAEALGPMIVIPRKASKALGKGATLKAPQAHAFIYVGGPPPTGVPYPVTDTTKVGSDYKLVDKKR